VYSAPRPEASENLQGKVLGFPSATSWGPGRLDVFARGDKNNALWHKWKEGNKPWSAWENLGGVIYQSPSCVSWGPNRIDCLVVGGGGHMYHKWWYGKWSGWENHGGVVTEAISCVARRERALDCFVRGTDMALYKMSWTDKTGWTPWVRLGGKLDSAPSCVAKQPDMIHCFFRGNDNNLKERSFQMDDNGSVANGEGEWNDLGGDIQDTPSAIYVDHGKIEVMVRGRNGRMKRRFHSDGRWHEWHETEIHLEQPVSAIRERGTRNIEYFLINNKSVMHDRLELLE